MQLHQLEHILRASGAIADEKVFIVVGSQAILASVEDPPPELLVSMEADLYPRDSPEKADLITGSIGEFSLFYETFGYHADGVSPDTAVTPTSWRDRLVALHNQNTGGVTGLCLGPVDIAISKLVAGREKDLEYVSALLRHGIVKREHVLGLLHELSPEHSTLVASRLLTAEARAR
ncbi:MAG: DUF6036 family nucleotidyltransferase [Candidatus Eremiobacterota bacterium]